MDNPVKQLERRIYTVSELTHSIKSLLENTYPFVWIAGEISNFRIPASGHFYFTLKDHGAQISSVMFRGQNRFLKFQPEDGTEIIGMGRITVFEPRGSYQIILEVMEPKGIGALQLAFEQLRKRLSDEGLFDETHKRPLPFLPAKIGVVTSPTGAVIRDIIHVARRRFDNMRIVIAPVRVQGAGAEKEIASALKLLNERRDVDVIILARGGGSLEDLQPFNTEEVARAVFESRIPVVSSVGHETDYTIADFVADVRAPTPSAAAEVVIPKKDDLIAQIGSARDLLGTVFSNKITGFRDHIHHISQRLSDPARLIANLRLRLDDNLSRINYVCSNDIRKVNERWMSWRERLHHCRPTEKTRIQHIELKRNVSALSSRMQGLVEQNRGLLRTNAAKLGSLSPLSTLMRGYSVTRRLPGYEIIKDAGSVSAGQALEVIVARGRIFCRVEKCRS
ncbi:MAG: exodeoxyribonuclease VII large subunit [Desulfobacterales bacterium C00003106]|jgi:exodeoxyribonuclease VII large subunit|nr:MAG: exodeoxyribonuclease VII large subunit [Desulfobacterales bacterium C00003106]